MLEKMPTFGGNSVINGGEMTAVGAPQQKAAGIKDSLDLWMKWLFLFIGTALLKHWDGGFLKIGTEA